MHTNSPVTCPACLSQCLLLKYEATYEYSYVIDGNAPGKCNTRELLPYMYDNREQKNAKQYVECTTCGATYSCYFDKWTGGISPDMLQEAITSDYLAKQQHL